MSLRVKLIIAALVLTNLLTIFVIAKQAGALHAMEELEPVYLTFACSDKAEFGKSILAKTTIRESVSQQISDEQLVATIIGSKCD